MGCSIEVARSVDKWLTVAVWFHSGHPHPWVISVGTFGSDQGFSGFELWRGPFEFLASLLLLAGKLVYSCLCWDLNILSWWKNNSGKYPILIRIAWDILNISTSIVASESTFNIGGNVIHCYKSRMKMDTVETLICAQ